MGLFRLWYFRQKRRRRPRAWDLLIDIPAPPVVVAMDDLLEMGEEEEWLDLPVVLLDNLPYNATFPVLLDTTHVIIKKCHRDLVGRICASKCFPKITTVITDVALSTPPRVEDRHIEFYTCAHWHLPRPPCYRRGPQPPSWKHMPHDRYLELVQNTTTLDKPSNKEGL